VQGAKTLLVLMLSTAEWASLSVLHGVSPDLSTKILLAKIEYLGIVTVPPAILVFVLQYTARERWLTSLNLNLMGIIPVLTLVLVWTNSAHHLVWKSVWLETSGSMRIAVYDHGRWFWIWICFTYFTYLISTFWFVSSLIRSPYLYGMQVLLMLIGICSPWLTTASYIFRLMPSPYIELASLPFTLSGLALVWGLFRFRILDIMPVAMKTALENIPDLVILLDSQDRIVSLNRSAQKITRITDSKASGKPVLKILGDQPMLAKCLSDGKATGCSGIVLGGDNSKHYYDLNVLPLKDGRNRSIGRLVILRDFTERKQMEKTLREVKEKYRFLFDNTVDAIFVLQDDVIKFANPKTEEITGYSMEELRKMSYADLIDPEYRDMVRERHMRRMNGEEIPSNYSFKVINKAGQSLWFHMHTVHLIRWEGKPATLNFIRDITEQKSLEGQLIRSERLAATGQLAASVAHQINSPLQGIGTLLSLMKKSCKDNDDLLENVHLLEGAFKSIGRTVKTLLDLNRPSQEEKQILDLNKVIEDMLALLKSYLKHNHIRIRINLSSKPLNLIASPQQLAQVLMNLISNAVEAIREQHGTAVEGEISIKTTRKGDRSVIEVTDSGPGIPEEALPRIFSPFYTKKKKMGMGLGLATCHKIVEDQGGSIEAINRPDSGATFIISFPIAN